MPKALPYFKWYPADAETDEFYTSLTDSERSFYHRCLNRSWINGGLPTDLDELAKAMVVSRKYLDKVWPKVSQRFHLNNCVRERFVNPRQEEERDQATKKSNNNKRVGNANAFKTRSDSNANVPIRASDSDSCVGINSKKAEKLEGGKKITFESDRDALWVWFQSEFPGDINPEWDGQIFISVIQTFEDIRDLRETLPLWKQTKKWLDGFHPSAENFLRKRMFKNRPKARDSPAGEQEYKYVPDEERTLTAAKIAAEKKRKKERDEHPEA